MPNVTAILVGESGYSGYSGHSGATGSAGSSGTAGANGVSGYSGAAGANGVSGYSGSNGTIGSNGASGYSGTAGANGVSGFSGYSAVGLSGYSGTNGISGFSGQNGTGGSGVGSSGFSGYSGAGTNGVSGFSGVNGSSGYSGYSGASGTNGVSGISGYSGKSGYSGYSGIGLAGSSGISGYSGATGGGGGSYLPLAGGNLTGAVTTTSTIGISGIGGCGRSYGYATIGAYDSLGFIVSLPASTNASYLTMAWDCTTEIATIGVSQFVINLLNSSINFNSNAATFTGNTGTATIQTDGNAGLSIETPTGGMVLGGVGDPNALLVDASIALAFVDGGTISGDGSGGMTIDGAITFVDGGSLSSDGAGGINILNGLINISNTGVITMSSANLNMNGNEIINLVLENSGSPPASNAGGIYYNTSSDSIQYFNGTSWIGLSGYSGYSGYSGKSGYSGYSGVGSSGFSGYSGKSGYSGTGTTGSSGFSGYSGGGGGGSYLPLAGGNMTGEIKTISSIGFSGSAGYATIASYNEEGIQISLPDSIDGSYLQIYFNGSNEFIGINELQVNLLGTSNLSLNDGSGSGASNYINMDGGTLNFDSASSIINTAGVLTLNAVNGITITKASLSIICSPYNTLTFSTTIATDGSIASDNEITATGNFTLSNPINPTDGQTFRWRIIQDSTGSRLITLDTNFNLGPMTVTLSTAANATDYLAAIYRSTTGKFDVTGFLAGY